MRQCNTFFPDDPGHAALKRRMAAETTAFIKSLRNFLRGPEDDETLRAELYDLAKSGIIPKEQASYTAGASTRVDQGLVN